MIRLARCLLVLLVLLAGASATSAAVRIKDITTVEGARGNHLYGLGLVVGLNNTGARTSSTQQAAIDLLRRLEQSTTIARQSLTDNVFKSNNIAQVWVDAELSDTARKGSRIDVSVSVADDATSLVGGRLIFTPLQGVDREVYAVAQGQVSIGGFPTRGANSGQQNHPTVGRVQNGAFVEREALGEINQNGIVRLLLRDADYSTSAKITQAINDKFPGAAKTVDRGVVQVRIPLPFQRRVTEFVGEVGQLSVTPDTTAKVIINERTGTVIVGHNVRVSGIGITHRNVVINPNLAALPRPTAGGSGTLPAPNPPTLLSPPKSLGDDSGLLPIPPEPDGKASVVSPDEQTFTVAELARVLNALGVTPQDLIAIFESLNDSGALHAELVIK